MVKIPERKYKYYTEEEKSMRTDGIFQTVFGNSAYPEILKDLLESILDIEIEEIEVSSEKNTMITKVNNMRMRYDLYVMYDKNNLLDIEMQNKNCYNIIQRLETNASALYHDAHKKGKKNNRYPKNIKTKAIAFLDYNEFKDGPYHEEGRIVRKSNGEEISDDIEYHFIQMPRFFEEVREIKSKKEAWIAYLSNQLNPEEMEEVFKMDENIRKVDELAKEIIEDEELMGEISRELVRRANDYSARVGMFNHGLEEGEKKGKIEGEAKGKIEGKKENQIEVAKELIKIGLPIEKIMQATKLTKEEIEELMK